MSAVQRICLLISALGSNAVNIPNQITATRIILIPLFIYFLLAQTLPAGKIIAALLFILLSLTDALDGYLARKLDQTSAFGALIDPLADKLLVYSALLIFVELGKLWAIFPLVIIARDFLVMGIRVWAAKNGKIIAASTSGKWKTASQMTAIVFMILSLPLWQVIFAISMVLCVYSGWEYFRQISLEDI